MTAVFFYRDPGYDANNATYFDTNQIETGEISGDRMILLRRSSKELHP